MRTGGTQTSARAAMTTTLLLAIACLLAAPATAQRAPFCEGLVEPGLAACAGLARGSCLARPACFWRDTASENRLIAHSAQFSEAVEEVAAGHGVRVLVARGFGLANSVILAGPTCFVVVDTGESVQVAQRVRAALEPHLRDTRLCGVVYTHSHADHVLGTAAWAPRGAPVWAHANFRHNFMLENLASRESHARSMRQYGTHLAEDADGRINAGIGPRLAMDANATRGYVRPSHTYTGRGHVCFEAALCVTLIASPGENTDQTSVWVPAVAAIVSADAYYHAFPNLYTIRGAAPRSPRDWWRTLDVLRVLGAQHLVPMHTRHISGAQRVARALEHFRDAIQYVHDRTLHCMNRGFAPDQIAIVLPEALAADPALAEFYGAIDWGVRAVYQFYYGWFDARAKHLQPLPNAQRGARLVRALGGADAALKHAADALAERTPPGFQWALELCDALREYCAELLVLRTTAGGELDWTERDAAAADVLRVARDIEIAALTKLGQAQINANARNFYLSAARALAGGAEPPQTQAQMLSVVYEANANFFLEALPMRLSLARARLAGERIAELTVHVHLYPARPPGSDHREPQESWALVVRGLHGILQVDRLPNNGEIPRANVALWADEEHVKALLLRPGGLARQEDAGTLALEPPGPRGRALMALFLSLFDL